MYAFNMSIGSGCIKVNMWTPVDAAKYGVLNWSLRPLQKPEDVFMQSRLSRGLRIALSTIGAHDAYAPAVDAMNARIITNGELKKILIGKNTHLYRNRECPADGVFLKPNEAFVASGAGCPIITAVGGPHMVVAHAGRDSLVDRGAVKGAPSRKNISVVHSIIEEFKKRGVPLDDVVMCMQFSIPTLSFLQRFDHPDYGEFNHALYVFIEKQWPGCVIKNDIGMFLDLEFLFIEQARQVGVQQAYAMNSLAQYPDLAHTRDGDDPRRRNLFVIKREQVQTSRALAHSPGAA